MELIKQLNNMYIENNDFVYKSRDDWIIIMKKNDNTITNENRDDVVNSSHALFRGNKFFIVKIFNKYDPHITTSYVKQDGLCLKNTKYIEGKSLSCDIYDYNLNNIHGEGIYYFKTIEPAFYLDNKTKSHKSWHYNGNKKIEG
jgi:hypothetical protein